MNALDDQQMEIIPGIEHGIDDMKTGRVVPHEDVMADIGAIIEKAKLTKHER